MTSNQLCGNSRRTRINEAKEYLKASPNNAIASVAERFELLYTIICTFEDGDREGIRFITDNLPQEILLYGKIFFHFISIMRLATLNSQITRYRSL